MLAAAVPPGALIFRKKIAFHFRLEKSEPPRHDLEWALDHTWVSDVLPTSGGLREGFKASAAKVRQSMIDMNPNSTDIFQAETMER